MENDHGDGNHAAQKGKGIQKGPKVSGVGRAQCFIEMKRHALEHIAKGHAKNDGRYETADKQSPVPRGAPFFSGHPTSVVKGYRTQNKGGKHDKERPVKSGEGRGVNKRPSGKDSTASR